MAHHIETSPFLVGTYILSFLPAYGRNFQIHRVYFQPRHRAHEMIEIDMAMSQSISRIG